ncbi:hypothetical protein K438DRAFT_2001919 [Mycena galopus ATCC 62051]|nr:hypothetical protein K438DRAFT_2001919 [Mycena galopus ATCC 62051]
MSSRHASKLPLLEQLVLAGSPWNPDRTDPVPSTKCIAVLTSIVHLTCLDTSVVLQNDADPALDALVRALSFVLTLQYVGFCFAGLRLSRVIFCYYADRHKMGYHDWEDVFRSMGIE